MIPIQSTVKIHPDDLPRFRKVKGESNPDKLKRLLNIHDSLNVKVSGKWTLDVKKYHKLREDDLPRMRH